MYDVTTIIFWLLFAGVVLLLIRVGDWAFPIAIAWIKKLFLEMGITGQSQVGVQQMNALVQEAEGYGNDWRLLIVAAAAKFAKLDGIVTKNELAAVEDVFANLELTGAQRPLAVDTFRRAKSGPTSFSTWLHYYHTRYQKETDLLQMLTCTLFAIAYADGLPNLQTQQTLYGVCQKMRFKYEWYAENEKRRRSRPKPRTTNVEAAYTILGCKPNDPLTVIKDRYRKLVKDFHPDTIMSKNLPDDFIKFAEDRFKQIQAAYESVLEERGARAV